jgi:carbon-monoxide dehydrogenase medium subunit
MSQFLLAPKSVEEAVSLLARFEMARPISGGATLVAMKNAGLIEASNFVSLAQVDELRGISRTDEGGVRLGGMTRHCETAASTLLAGSHAVLRQAASVIASRPVRNMGTIGGSVANADPAADYLPALVCLDARIEIAGVAGRRFVPVGEFILDWYETALRPGEIITAIILAPPRPGPSAYRKLARVSGDFATVSCAMVADANEAGQTINVAIGACAPSPVRDRDAEEALRGKLDAPEAVGRFTARLVELADPVDDVRGSATYRLEVMPRLVTAVMDDLGLLKRRADG